MKNTLSKKYKGCQIWHLFFALILCLSFVNVQSASYIVNKEHSKLKFKVKYMALTDVEGQFEDYKIYFDMKNKTISNLVGQIKVNSINTFDKKRDQHLKKDDFFDAKKYPVIKFQSVQPFSIKEKEVKTEIQVKIKKVQKTVPVKITYLGKRSDPWTEKEGHYFQGSFIIDRFDFDINWSKTFDGGNVVDKDVHINFTIEAYQSNEKPAFSRFYLPTNSVKREVSLDAKTSGGDLIMPEKKAPKSPAPQESSSYSAPMNITLTLFSTAIVFALAIGGGIWGQQKLVKLMESKNISDNLTFLLSTVIVTTFIAVIFYITTKYTGIGTHPLFNR
ncbi:YceI family protein [Halobacteriovorax sp. DPLXC-1]|uniref:YceI family protein n=1 Tax=Halobacteriovorax sp. DPLXC-1 TaxID=3110771 RepID=UPI002FEE772F